MMATDLLMKKEQLPEALSLRTWINLGRQQQRQQKIMAEKAWASTSE